MVYKMLTAFYKNKDDLAKSEPGFMPMARDFVGMQVQGINANPEIPVHPGLVKFLKEHKAWNDSGRSQAASKRINPLEIPVVTTRKRAGH